LRLDEGLEGKGGEEGGVDLSRAFYDKRAFPFST
jgi:hypothetical protein